MKEPISLEKQIAVTSDGFSRQIISRYAGFGSYARHFHPLISTGGTIPLLGRWIELIYAMPFFSIRREVTTQRIESMITQTNQPVSLILNFLLNFSEPQHIFQSQNRILDETLKKLAISSQSSYFYPTMTAFASPVTSLFWLSRAIIQLHRQGDQRWTSREWPQVSTHTQPVLRETDRLVTERAKGISPEENRQHLVEGLAPLLLAIRYNPMLLSYHLPTIIHMAREPAISPAARQITTSLAAPLPERKGEQGETPGYTGLSTDRVDSAGSRQAYSLTAVPAPTQGVGMIQRGAAQGAVAQREAADGSRLNVLKLTKIEPTYRTYPVMETIISRENPQIIRETQVIEKEVATKQSPPPKIDIERLTEEVYRLFERRIRIERERRGL